MLSENDELLILKVIGLVVRLVGIYDRIDEVVREVEPISIVNKQLVDLLLSSARPQGVCLVLAGLYDEAELLVDIRWVFAEQFERVVDGRTQPTTDLKSIEIPDGLGNSCPMLLSAGNKRHVDINWHSARIVMELSIDIEVPDFRAEV